MLLTRLSKEQIKVKMVVDNMEILTLILGVEEVALISEVEMALVSKIFLQVLLEEKAVERGRKKVEEAEEGSMMKMTDLVTLSKRAVKKKRKK